jgi:plasmid stability protein
MALLQVRNFPDDIYAAIREEAHRERRSIAQQTVLFVERGMRADSGRAVRRRMALERAITRDVPEDFGCVDFTSLIREDRER